VASDADVARRAVVVHCADDGRVRLRVGAAAAAELPRETTEKKARRSYLKGRKRAVRHTAPWLSAGTRMRRFFHKF
jgi:hypothetical protein